MTTSTAPIRWTIADLRGTLRSADRWWDLLSAGVDDRTMRTPAAPGAVSVAELRAADRAGREGLDLRAVDDDDAPLVEATLALLSEAGRALVALGAGAAPAQGTVEGLFVSDGGVPKHSVDAVRVGPRGLEGDRQAARQHHGRVWQALCLWSGEVVDRLAAEGHPIAPGRAGENISVRGIDWSTMRPGVRLRMGEVLAELSIPSEPCVKNRAWFRDGDFMRMAHDREPGVSRWYATVREPGAVAVGDEVLVEP